MSKENHKLKIIGRLRGRKTQVDKGCELYSLKKKEMTQQTQTLAFFQLFKCKYSGQ